MNQEMVDIGVIAEEGAPQLPTYGSEEAAGADIRANVSETITLQPGERKLIPTGLRVDIPKGYEIQVRPRSGLAYKSGITVLNTPGTIDSDYRGELGVVLINHGNEPFEITHGMRIAQLVVSPVIQARFLPVETLSTTGRGEGGYGHTGLH